MPYRSKWFRIGISLGLAFLLLYFFVKNLDFVQVADAIGAADRASLAFAVFLSLANIPIRTWRWTRLVRHVGAVKFRDAFSATCIGFAATTLLPARAGEVVRPVALARTAKLPVSPLLASIGFERLLDLLAILLLFVVYALGGWAPGAMSGDEQLRFALLRKSALLVGAGAIAAVVILFVLSAFPERRELFLRKITGLLPQKLGDKVHPILSGFLKGFDAIRTAQDAAAIVLSTAALWLVISLQVHVTMRAFDVVHPFPVAFFVLTWGVLGLAIPTPGGVGGYHKAVAYALTGFYAVAEAPAAAFAIVSHFVSFVPITLLGLFFLASSGLSFGKLEESKEGESAPPKG
jgi:uncharacterized protein (TIRG00374 family)